MFMGTHSLVNPLLPVFGSGYNTTKNPEGVQMIQFPAIFKLSGQDELLLSETQSNFMQHYQLQQSYLLPDDLLIDSTGQAYSLKPCPLETVATNAVKEFSLQELTALVQTHFFASAQTCVTKIQAPDIKTLFSLLKHSS
jgi:hypothetical protein